MAHRSRRAVIEVREEVHSRVRKLALLNDLRIYELANALIEDCLKDEARVSALVKQLKVKKRAI